MGTLYVKFSAEISNLHEMSGTKVLRQTKSADTAPVTMTHK